MQYIGVIPNFSRLCFSFCVCALFIIIIIMISLCGSCAFRDLCVYETLEYMYYKYVHAKDTDLVNYL